MQSKQQDSILQGHLPECPTTTDPHGLDDGYACPCECQCEILRACEQRVLEEAVKNRYMELNEARRQAYSVGLHRAREAVTALCQHPKSMPNGWLCSHALAISAIDTLRDQPADQTGYEMPDVRRLAADLIEEYAEARHQPHTPRYDCGRCDLTAALRTAAHEIRRSS